MSNLIQKLKDRITKPLPGQDAQMMMASPNRKVNAKFPETAKQSGVILLLHQIDMIWHILLMQRTRDGHAHSGQISFPGGKKELHDETLIHTALRECEEEIGISQNQIEVLGLLTPLYIPASNFLVTPTLGFMNDQKFKFHLSTKEVEEVYSVSLKYLFSESAKQTRLVHTTYMQSFETKSYILPKQQIVWGATAMILSEFEQLIREFNDAY